MNTIAIIIVTAFINIIITGIVSNLIFSRFEKNIELSFAKKLEEYKANLAFSNFEQQTKFARFHANTVETLETLYHKFAEYFATYVDIFAGFPDGRNYYVARHEFPIQSAKLENIRQQVKDFLRYFQKNRLFLPDVIIREVESIAFAHHIVVNDILCPIFKDSLLPEDIESMNFALGIMDSEFIVDSDLEKVDLQPLISEIGCLIEANDRKLEALYKSVTETKQA